jgi:hypothetical protein
MNNTLVALMFGIGAGGWIYYQMMRRTGSNTKASLITAALGGVVAAFVIYTLFTIVFPAPEVPAAF